MVRPKKNIKMLEDTIANPVSDHNNKNYLSYSDCSANESAISNENDPQKLLEFF